MALLRVFAALLPALGWLGGALSGPCLAQEPLKIGLSGPYSGGSASLGIGLRDGAKLAAEEINAAGGVSIGGTKRPILFIERDDKANNGVGEKVTRELVDDEKVIATIGYVNAGVALASQYYYQQAKIPVLVCAACGTKVAQQFAPPNYIFRNTAYDLIQSRIIADEAVVQRRFKYVAIFADTTNYGERGRVDLEVALAHREVFPVAIEMFKLGAKDMTQALTRAKDAGAEVILTYAIGPELAAIANGMAKIGWKVPIIGSWTLSSSTFIDQAGPNAEGAVMVQTFIQEPLTPKSAAFIAAYQKRFNVDRMPSPVSAAQCYDAVYILAAAIEQAQSADGEKIREALENLGKRIEGVVTTYDHPFTAEDHDAISANIPVLGVIRGGRVTPAHPEDFHGKTVRVKAAP